VIRAGAALAALGVGVIEADGAGRIVSLNRFAEQMTGWSVASARGRPLDSVLRLVDDTGVGFGELGHRLTSPEQTAGRRDEALVVRRDGNTLPVEYSISPAFGPDAATDGLLVVLIDASERRLMALHMARASHHDLLTGLLNRTAFTGHLATALEGSRENGEHHVLCFLDIDQFKLVNETCGHEAGDDLLQWVAAILREIAGERDSIARFGGDEFAVLLARRSLQGGIRFAEGLLTRLREFTFSWGDKAFAITAAVGIVPITAQSGSPAQLLSAADHSCYRAKDKGRSGIQVFGPRDSEATQRFDEMNLVAQINRRLRDGSAQLYAQPIRRLTAGPPLGLQLEVLLRFVASDGQVQDPGKIIRATERFGLMPTVDRWVISNTLRQLKEIGRDGLNRIHVCFMNLSGLSLQDATLLDYIRAQLSESGVPPHKIGFEITETAAVQNLQQAQWFIQEVRSIGCRLSLDDFGTGMASYAYLKSLSVEYLKIDGGFVEAMLSSPLDRAMVESINQISHVLGMQTVAESVGNPEILAQVKEIGIDHAQGFWIAHPQPMAATCSAG
jgi:diguanylate cyclase (GGDEF)-like protein/PAS domain S-box-containing protein